MRRRRGAQFFFFMAENYSYSQGKNLNSVSPHFIFAHQTTLSFPSLFFSFTTCRLSRTMMIASTASSSASSSFCATARVGRFDDGVFRKKMSSSSSFSSSAFTGTDYVRVKRRREAGM